MQDNSHQCRVVAAATSETNAFRWPMLSIACYEKQDFSGVDPDVRSAQYDRAMRTWNAVSALCLHRVSDPSIANIEAGVGPIDGPYGVLALSDIPQNPQPTTQLQEKFDQDEPWSTEQDGIDLLRATDIHELGHSLGLMHDDDPSSIMYPTIRKEVTQLGPNDIARIQSLYGDPPEASKDWSAVGRLLAPYVLGPYADAMIAQAEALDGGDRGKAFTPSLEAFVTAFRALSDPVYSTLDDAKRAAVLRQIAAGLASVAPK
jgi:hypothetical protein